MTEFEPKIIIDSKDDRMAYGHRTFKDGTIVPFCKYLPDVIVGSKDNDPKFPDGPRGPYQWLASDIKETRTLRNGKSAYILKIDKIIVGIVDGLPACWFHPGTYRMDDKEHERDLI